MDDFGTGYSSLSCLQKFPVSGLKLDHNFVGDLTENATPTAANPVLTAITMMAQGMKMPMVAEGVENDEQFQKLRDSGCEFVQGYLFAPPMNAAAATAFIAGVSTQAALAA